MSRSVLRRIGIIATVVALGGLGLTPAAHAATPGTIAGTLTNDGAPAPDVFVSVDSETGEGGYTTTDSAGHYSVGDLQPGQYRVRFAAINRPDQFAYGKTDYESANIITVTSGGTTTVNDTILDTGTISGFLVDSQGNPVPDAHVSASSPAGLWGFAVTSSDGSYSMALYPGSYTVSFRVGSVEQFAYGKTYEDADVFTVAADATTTVNETLMPTGTVTGRVTLSNGSPAADVEVEALSSDGGSGPSVTTDADGVYHLTYLTAGSYKISFRLPSGAVQYAHDSRNLATALVVAVAAGSTVTVDESLLPTGAIAGKFTTAAGAAIPDVSVQVRGIDGEWGISTTTDASGNYRVDQLFAASGYRVHFADWDTHVDQWAYGKLSVETANTFTVTAGATTTVNEKKLATGSVKVTAKNAVTGAAISSFTARVRDDLSGETTSGSLVIGNVPVGTHKVEAWSEGYDWGTATVTVTAGAQAAVTVSLMPMAKINVKVVDRITGAPLEGVYVLPQTRTSFVMPDGTDGPTEADGTDVLQMSRGGTYQLFVFPKEGSGYGAQWVGATGGTGHQVQAQSFTVANGQTITAPVIKLDKAGTITGKITSATGAPLKYGSVTMAPQSYHSGGGFGLVGTDADGNYTIDFLGPYTWPLLITAQSHAMQWSDGTAYRYHPPKPLPRRPAASGATDGTTVVPGITGPGTGTVLPRRTTTTAVGTTTTATATVTTATVTAADLPRRERQPLYGLYGVKVTTGATTTFNYTMKAGVGVKAVVPGVADGGFVDVYNATTGDFIGSGWGDDLAAGTIPILLLPGTKVKFISVTQEWQWCGGTTFENTPAYTVTTSTTQTFSCTVS